jgi:hypothetical protein
VEAIPVWALFIATTLLVVVAIESGFLLGRKVQRRSGKERESPVSAIAAGTLALLAFMMAFTFGIVSDRYDARKDLVRQEANAIRTAWQRSDFLPEPDRTQAVALLKEYVDHRLAAVRPAVLDNPDLVTEQVAESVSIQSDLWDMAVANYRAGFTSDVAALYDESLNEIVSVHQLRIAVAWQARIPLAVWLILYALVLLSMSAIGYQAAIAESSRSWAMLMLALSFSLVFALIAMLDNPANPYIAVSQQPLIDLQASMAAGIP